MSDEEIIKLYEEMIEYYGDKLANFEHHPLQFKTQLKFYKYYKEQNENRSLQ